MDKRYNPIPISEQLALRLQAIEDVLANPQWRLAEVVHHLRTTLRLTAPELATLAKVSTRTLHEIESGRSSGTVQTLDSLLGVVGLRLGAQRVHKVDVS